MFEVVDWASIVGGGLGSKFDVGGGIELAGSGINAVDGTTEPGTMCSPCRLAGMSVEQIEDR